MGDMKTLVKMLKWVSEPPYRVARVLGGHYAVEVHDAGATLSGNFTRVLHFATGADAEAAAQSDYEARIRFVLADALASHEARIAELEGALRGLLKANDDVQTVLCDGPEVPGFDPKALGEAQRRVTEAEAIARRALHLDYAMRDGAQVTITKSQRFLLQWLAKADVSALRECYGDDLDALVDLGYARVLGQAVSITAFGFLALAPEALHTEGE